MTSHALQRVAAQTGVTLIPGTNLPMLELVPIDAGSVTMIAEWIADDKARSWLDLGGGRQHVLPRELYVMLISPKTCARLFRAPGTTDPLGLVVLNDVGNEMGSAECWGMRGTYVGGPRNAATAAFLLMLATGFVDYGREVIGSWVTDGNGLSLMMHHRLGLKETGRQRLRHRMNGVLHDRLLFDMTRDEFVERFADVPAESGRRIADIHPQTAA